MGTLKGGGKHGKESAFFLHSLTFLFSSVLVETNKPFIQCIKIHIHSLSPLHLVESDPRELFKGSFFFKKG